MSCFIQMCGFCDVHSGRVSPVKFYASVPGISSVLALVVCSQLLLPGPSEGAGAYHPYLFRDIRDNIHK